VTVDPERDTPDVLKRYAATYHANPAGWAFLTGTPAEVAEVGRRYGIFARRSASGDEDHTFLTSVIDGDGVLRVQYLGVRFDPAEFLRDLRTLLQEVPAR
jgi:protein SCO1/2